MNSVNRGSCFWCGEPVDEGSYDEIGHTRVWICGARECVKHLAEEQRGAHEEVAERAREDNYERYY